MLFFNTIFLCLLTVGSILYTWKNRSQLACMDGMIIAMGIGSMSSVTLGMNLVFLAGDLTVATILAVMIGMAVGYTTGRLVSLTASIEGVMAGLMGGMMSPMLGAMLVHPMPLIWFLDAAFLIVLCLLILLVKEAREAFLEEARQLEQNQKSSP